MNYTISFCVSALIILVILFLVLMFRKQLNLLQNKVYLLLIISTLLGACFDIWNAVIANAGTASYEMLQLTCTFVFIFQNMSIFWYACYAKSLVDLTFKHMTTAGRVLLVGPMFLAEMLIIINPYTGFLFTYSPNGVYFRGPLLPLIFAIDIFYAVLTIVNMRHYQDGTRKSYVFIPVVSCGIMLVALVAQSIYPRYLLMDFAITVCILLYLILIQKPEEAIDPATGVFNKYSFDKMFNTKKRIDNRYYALLIFVEDTRILNQVFGVDVVNKVLASIAKFLEKFAKQSVYYLGSNTFAMIMENKGYAHVTETIRQIDERFEQRWDVGESGVYITIRIMKILIPDDVTELDGIYSYAEHLRELDNSKKWIVSASETNLQNSNRKLLIENAVKNAIRNDSFDVFYQPIYSVKDKKICSAEALVRLTDPVLGAISPMEFIPIAEKNGTILKLGAMIFERVCRFMHDERLQEKGIHYIEINLSIVQCMQETLAEELLEIMKRYGVEAGRINLEITETAAVSSPRILVRNMQKLFEHGVGFSLDDFGTGYSNINSLANLPLDMIKFDKSMIDSMSGDDKGMMLLISSIAMVKRMDLEIVAEGVETKAQAEQLSEMGIDYLQGYFFSKPIPSNEFIRFIASFDNEDVWK